METKSENQTITQDEAVSAVGRILTEKAEILTIDVKPKTALHRLLIRLKIRPSKRIFEIKPQRVINIHRIALRQQRIDVGDIFTSIDRIGSLMRLMATNAEDIFYIVATAIQNDHREPTAAMIDIVRNEFEMKELYDIMVIAVGNYNVTAFINTTALIKGINDLNTGPTE